MILVIRRELSRPEALEQTHQSTTDPDSMLCRRQRQRGEAGYAGHLLMENRNGLVVSACVTPATGTAERDVALDFAER